MLCNFFSYRLVLYLFYVHLVTDTHVSHPVREDSYVFSANKRVNWHVDDVIEHPLRLGNSQVLGVFNFEFFGGLGH